MCLDLNIYNDYEYGNRRSSSYSSNTNLEVLEVNFTVVSKGTGIEYDVYAVRNNEFLIFFNGSFVWQNMNYFRPCEETEQEKLSKETKTSMFKSQRKVVNRP